MTTEIAELTYRGITYQLIIMNQEGESRCHATVVDSSGEFSNHFWLNTADTRDAMLQAITHLFDQLGQRRLIFFPTE